MPTPEEPLPPPPTDPAVSDASAQPARPGGSRRLSPSFRRTLTGLLLSTTAASLLYHFLSASGLNHSSALFIGLPLVIGLLIVHLTRSDNQYGDVLRMNVVFLCIVAPLLGEGSICLLMAAPLFIGVSLLSVALGRADRKSTGFYSVLCLPFVIGTLESHTELLAPETEVVTTRLTVPGTADEWRTTLQQGTPRPADTGWFLDLGFPTPQSVQASGDELTITFEMSGRPGGEWRARRETTESGVRFHVTSDTTKIGSWIQVLDSELRVESTPAGQTVLIQTTRFLPGLSPHWYFVPLERKALRDAHALSRDSWFLKP